MWTQGLTFARQEIYHFNHTFSLFVLVIFQIGSHTFCLGPALDHDLPSYASWVAGIRCSCQHTWLICWDGVLVNFCLGWPWTLILPEKLGLQGCTNTPGPRALNFYIANCNFPICKMGINITTYLCRITVEKYMRCLWRDSNKVSWLVKDHHNKGFSHMSCPPCVTIYAPAEESL
jgi:hypothetical protein